MLGTAMSASVVGVEGVPVRVEVDVAFGLPGLTIVGLAGSAVLEARERVRSAIRNSNFEMPPRRITVNLAPADLPKEGTGYDLAIAVAMLVASQQLEAPELPTTALIGELALDGTVRPVPGVMALVTAARAAGIRSALVPEANLEEAAAVFGPNAHGVPSLRDAVAHLAGVRELPAGGTGRRGGWWRPPPDAPDLAGIAGQRAARRALEIAVAGRHNVAFSGPPGVGKTLLARAAAGILPPLTEDEAAEVSRIHSVAGSTATDAVMHRRRPYRMPHHTISTQALVGGGPRIRPGEASLAHRGALVLDETLQFRTDALDALRGPMDAGVVAIARVEGVLCLPARFMLIATFNPCPCGWFGSRSSVCACDDGVRRRYQARLSGPMRDRLDLAVTLEPLSPLPGTAPPEPSAIVARRVRRAWRLQQRRQGTPNAELPAEAIGAAHGFGPAVRRELDLRGRQLGLSMRRLHRAARLARTIADLEGSADVRSDHVDEALFHRPMEQVA